MMYALDNIGLIPAVLSDIEHRSDVNPYYPTICKEGIVRDTFGKLPIFVSPMTCIVNDENFNIFNKRVTAIYPREQLLGVNFENEWQAYSLEQFAELFVFKGENSAPNNDPNGGLAHYKALIDVANGHMKKIYDYVKQAKQVWGDQLTVMIGNIANPDAYVECCKSGVDYVRIGIGGGNACTTGVQTGIHASMVWILERLRSIKKQMSDVESSNSKGSYQKELIKKWGANGFRTKIIADGGIDTIDKAIKCLALGADYVMMGKLFAQTEEACGKTTTIDYGPNKGDRLRQYYGMASVAGKKALTGKESIRNIEGIETWIPIKYSLNAFLDKFEDALRSCMSYCGAHNLDEFIGKVQWELMTETEFKSFYK